MKGRHVAPENHLKPRGFVVAHGSLRAPGDRVPREVRVAAVAAVVALVACSNDERPPAAVPAVSVDADRADDTALPREDTGATTSDATSDADATIADAPLEVADLGPPPDAAIFERCTATYAAYPTKGLVAAGMTPKAFADAYNAEVASLTYPGPFLLVFKGVDSADTSQWKLAVGALDVAGTDVKFFGAPAEVTYKMSAGIALSVADQTASFKLRFDSEATKAQLPVDAIRLTAAAGDCSELSVDELVLIIPESAKNVPFAGKTVGALMGAPIVTDGGPKFFVLELLGSEKKASFAGGTP